MRRLFLAGAAVALLVVVAYRSVFSYGFVAYDDETFILDDPAVKGGVGAALSDLLDVRAGVYWQPVAALSLAITRTLFGLDPRAFHVENVLWHVACASLVLLILASATGLPGRATAVAALFALHPVQVEAVAWAIERKTLVAAFFGLAAAYAYVGWTRAPSRARMALVVALGALSVLAKPSVIVLPALLVALDVWPLDRFRQAPLRRLLEKLPLAGVCLALGLVVVSSTTVEESVGHPLSLRLANAASSVFRHLWHLAWPSGLAVYYPYPDSIPGAVVLAAALALVLVSVAAWVFRREAPYVAAGWSWFLVALLPTLGVLQPGRWPAYADRYAYVPSIGVAFAVVWGVADLTRRARPLAPVLAIAAVLALGAATARQTTYWRSSVTLFARSVSVAPDSGHVHYNYGSALARAGRREEGIAHLRTAVLLEPTPRAYTNLAAALADDGRYLESVDAASAALRLAGDDSAAHYNLGRAYWFLGAHEQAVLEFRAALATAKAPYPEALGNLGAALNRLGRYEETIATLDPAMGTAAAVPEVRFNLGVAFAARGDGRASRELQALRTLSPPLAAQLEGFIVQSMRRAPPPTHPGDQGGR